MDREVMHFVGIGGIGMSAIALVLLSSGECVTGSDASDSPILATLRRAGAKVVVGHDASNVDGASIVVVSSAIDPLNPEYQAATERGIPIVPRGAMLARIMQGRRGIAICGTHGKTTTTAMTAAVLRAGGIDASLVLGGIDVNTGSNAHAGTAPWFLTEADESDGSFRLLDPSIAVLTNVENDHLSCDDDLPKLIGSFQEFLRKIPEDGVAIIGTDNLQSSAVAPAQRRCRTVTYGIASDADLRAENLRFEKLGSSFEAVEGDLRLGTIELGVPGAINVENALAAVAVGRALALPFDAIAQALFGFRGVRRRFEILAKTPRMIVVDDYAHHPTAVRETIVAARQYHRGPIVVAFQPHRYTRTAYLGAAFAEALSRADVVYLAPVYAASESPIEGVNERMIGEPLRGAGTTVRYVKYVHDLRAAILNEAPPNALVLMLGAGNITTVAADLARDVRASAA